MRVGEMAKVRKLIGEVKCIFCGANAVYKVLTKGESEFFVCERDFKRVPSFIILEARRIVGGKAEEKRSAFAS